MDVRLCSKWILWLSKTFQDRGHHVVENFTPTMNYQMAINSAEIITKIIFSAWHFSIYSILNKRTNILILTQFSITLCNYQATANKVKHTHQIITSGSSAFLILLTSIKIQWCLCEISWADSRSIFRTLSNINHGALLRK